LTIFVVEDDDELREFLDSLLSADHSVVPFSTGNAALAALRSASPDILLSDIELPDRGGDELAREALKSSPRTKVVLMSGNVLRLELARPYVHGLILKPFSISELAAVLKSVLEK
jgi:CheY-like chemotaxis protein